MHPAFYQVFLWVWIKIFGDSEWALRGTSLLFFAINCSLIYSICIKLHSRNTAFYVLAFFCGLSYFIINTTYARPYNSGLFFILLSWIALLHFHKSEKPPLRIFILLILSLAGSMYSHYFSFLASGMLGFVSLFYVRNKWALVLCGLIALLLFVPHIAITQHHLSHGGLGWLGKPGWNWIFLFFHEMFNYSWILLIAGFLLALYALLKANIWNSFARRWMLVWFILLYIAAYFISIFYTPILRETVMIFSLPLFFIAIFAYDNGPKLSVWPAVFLLILFSLHSIFFDKYLEATPNGVFKQIASHFEEDKKYTADSNFAINTCNVDYLNYYLVEDKEESIIDWTSAETLYALHQRVENSKSDYFQYAWTNNFHLPMYLEIIRRKYPQIISYREYPNGEYVLFGKKKGLQTKKQIKQAEIDNLIFPQSGSDEFLGGVKFPLRQFITERKAYYLIEYSGEFTGSGESYVVATVERNGEMIKNKDDQPILYQAYDFTKLVSSSETGKFYLAFEIMDSFEPDMDLHVYIYNPGQNKIELTNLKLYEINLQ